MEDFEPTPLTNVQHKKQTLWQIWVPLFAAILVMFFLCVITVLFTTRDVTGEFNTKWAGISIIYLAIPAFLEAFIVFLIVVGLIFLFTKLLQITPVYTRKVTDFMDKVSFTVRQYSDKAARPIISIKSKWSGFKALFKQRSTRTR